MEIDVYFTMDRSGSCVMTSGFSIVDNHESFIQNMFFFFFFFNWWWSKDGREIEQTGIDPHDSILPHSQRSPY